MIKRFLITALLLACIIPVATAQNTMFLRRAAIANLTAGDQDLLRAAFREALNEAADGETVAWSNSKTGHSGRIEILDTHEDFETTCRTARISTQAGGREGTAVQRLCKADDGRWAFAPDRRS